MNQEQIAKACIGYIRLYRKLEGWSHDFSFKLSPRIYRAQELRDGEVIGEHCQFIDQQEVERRNKRSKIIIKRLQTSSKFVKWLMKKSEFKKLLELLEKRRPWQIWWNQDFNSHFDITPAEHVRWKFLFVVACAILVYVAPNRFLDDLARLGELEPVKPSKKAQTLAARLYQELAITEIELPRMFGNDLNRIANGGTATRRLQWGEVVFSANQRRRLMIREIACVSRNHLTQSRSVKGRFPPDLVLLILAIVGNQTDLRTIQFIQKSYDENILKSLSQEDKFRSYPLTQHCHRSKKRVAHM